MDEKQIKKLPYTLMYMVKYGKIIYGKITIYIIV